MYFTFGIFTRYIACDIRAISSLIHRSLSRRFIIAFVSRWLYHAGIKVKIVKIWRDYCANAHAEHKWKSKRSILRVAPITILFMFACCRFYLYTQREYIGLPLRSGWMLTTILLRAFTHFFAALLQIFPYKRISSHTVSHFSFVINYVTEVPREKRVISRKIHIFLACEGKT